jgi:hypothetical protein
MKWNRLRGILTMKWNRFDDEMEPPYIEACIYMYINL